MASLRAMWQAYATQQQAAALAGLTSALTTDSELAAAVAGIDLSALVPKSLVDAKGDLLVGSADNTVTRQAVGADGQVLTADAASPGGVKWAASGGGGSSNAPDGKPTILTLPASPNAKDDEFNDASGMSGPVNGLDAKWSKHNLATSSWLALDDTKAPGCLLFNVPTGQATDQAIYQAVPAGDFRAYSQFSVAAVGDRQMWGLGILDTSGNGAAVVVDSGDNAYLRQVTAWQQGAFISASLGGFQSAVSSGAPITVSIRKAGGVYYAAASCAQRLLPGAFAEASGTPSAFTPAYLVFGRFYGTSSSTVLLDSLRVG